MNRLISNSKRILFFVLLVSLTIIVSAIPTQIPAQGSIQGSIQTTDITGTAVNQNLFLNKADVYLNGGPQNANANGLPVGTYYFQVTEPNGTLLSIDPAACRQLVVALNFNGKGVVSGMAPFGAGANQRPITCSATDHLNGVTNPVNGTTPVQLMPFDNTTNNGGEYKVWLILKTSNTTVASNGIVINFQNNDSKTDNFKVRTANPPPPDSNITYTLRGCKFYDRNANGVWETGEPKISGVRIFVTINGVADLLPVVTGGDGCWERPGVPSGAEYTVEESLPLTGMEPAFYWVQTAPSEISIPIPGGMPNDFYTVRAYQGTATGGTPSNGIVTINNLDFGNLCFGPNNTGKTKGYWTNKNGENEMKNGIVDTNVYPGVFPQGMTGALNFLSALNLKGEAVIKQQAVTPDFNPTFYGAFKDWLSSSNAYNMSYMLSAQMAASSLNVRHKRFGDGQIVDARNVCDGSGYCLGLIKIGNVRMLADHSLGNAGGNITISGSPHRQSQELMKNFLDAINNNWLAFAQSEPCPVVYPFLPAP